MRFKVEFRQERKTAPQPVMVGETTVAPVDPPRVVNESSTWFDYFPATSISEALAKAESYNTSGYARVISIREAP